MPAIGITGGVATGKSAFCMALRELLPGATIFNADTAARELVTSDAEVREQIAAEFGQAIFSGAGELNRAELRAIVFASAERRSVLEKILHPRIRRRWGAEAKTFSHSKDYFFADIPLLYETGGESLCDRVVVVACAPDIQIRRLLERSSIMDRLTAESMIGSQLPLTHKIVRGDHVVWNDGNAEILKRQAKLLIDFWQTEK